jgi:rSAM/selenodomain-associated transferase 2
MRIAMTPRFDLSSRVRTAPFTAMTAGISPCASMRISVIVPVLNEAPIIRGFLLHLRTIAQGIEIIVVDGGSEDGTSALCKDLADQIVHSPRGRAAQMNAGAAVATGELLWFLHADSRVPATALHDIQNALTVPHSVGGCFRLRFPRSQWIYRVSDSLGNIGVGIFGFALGDHGIFCRRAAFAAVGGYPDVALLEDAQIYRRLRRRGRMRQVRAEIVSSPRAYEAHGPYRTTAIYLLILALYIAHVPIPFLHLIYRAFIHPAQPLGDSGRKLISAPAA